MNNLRISLSGVVSLIALAVLTSLPAQAQNLVVNPGFETGDFTGWTVTPATSGSAVQLNAPSGHTGIFEVIFGATNFQDDVLTQTITTIPGQKYTFSFWLQNLSTGNDHFSASFGSTEVFGITNSSSAFPYTLFSNEVTATTASTVIRFAGYDASGFFVLDDVSLTAINNGGATAPEPASLAFLGMAALPLAGVIRRRMTQ